MKWNDRQYEIDDYDDKTAREWGGGKKKMTEREELDQKYELLSLIWIE